MPRTQYPTRPQRRSKRRTREQKFLEQVHLNAAGIDIGSGSHWVAVPTDRDEQPVREFRSFTHALIDLADWLTACDIDTVAMESTGVYWIPLYETGRAEQQRFWKAIARGLSSEDAAVSCGVSPPVGGPP